MLLNYFFQWSPQMIFYNEPLRFGKLIRTPDRLLMDTWPTPDRLPMESWQTPDGSLIDPWWTPDGHLTDSWLTPDQLQEINFKVSIWRAVPIELSNDESPLAPMDQTDPKQTPCQTSNWSWLTSWLTLKDILQTPGGPRLTFDRPSMDPWQTLKTLYGPSTDPPDRPQTDPRTLILPN